MLIFWVKNWSVLIFTLFATLIDWVSLTYVPGLEFVRPANQLYFRSGICSHQQNLLRVSQTTGGGWVDVAAPTLHPQLSQARSLSFQINSIESSFYISIQGSGLYGIVMSMADALYARVTNIHKCNLSEVLEHKMAANNL